MFKKFLNCKNDYMRYNFFKTTEVKDWSDEALNSLATILNVEDLCNNMVPAGKYLVILETLRKRSQNVA